MSQIPANAISAAVTPIQRQSNDALRARQVQSAKNAHHAEDIQELDDTAVDSIRDDQQGNQQQQDKNPKQNREDKVEIQNLDAPSLPPTARPPLHPELHLPRLDISA